ncbi:MAG: alpha/beta hydrolase [Alphaproteobacteria bacterium]
MNARRIVFAGAALLLLGATATIFAFQRDMRRARTAVATGSSIIDTIAGPIEYAVRGEGAPLLTIHGAGGGFDQGLDNVDGLVGKGFRVIAPSRFGYLRTPVPTDTSPAAQAEAHAALLHRLGFSRVIVVGVSAGARSALELAIRHPDRVSALVLIVPGTYAPTSPVMIEPSRGSELAFFIVNHGGDFAWWAAEKIAPEMLIRFLGVPPDLVSGATPDQRARVLRIMNSVEPLSMRFAGINIDSQPALHALPLDKIAAPTLVISSRDDLFNTAPAAEYAASRIAGAKLVIYETGGHLLVGREAETEALVQEFLAAVPKP